MIEILRETLKYLFLTVLASSILAPIMINILYRFNQVSGIKKTEIDEIKGDNSLFLKIMNVTKTNGTPNMGGILIWITVPVMTLLLTDVTPLIQVLLYGFVLYGFWGFLDVVIFTNGFKKNPKIKVLQESFEFRLGKLLFTILMNIGLMFLLYRTGLFEEMTFFNVATVSVTPALVALSGILGQFAIYSSELTDGLDGLLIGIFAIITTVLMILLLAQGNYEFLPFLGIVLGVLIIDLYFNIPPARFWNGGPGAMPLGFALFYIGLVTNNLIPYLVMSSITWLIMFSSAIQIVAFKFFHKRVFKIAPIHHHFQAVGWPQYKVTMRFWLFTFISALLGLLLGIL